MFLLDLRIRSGLYAEVAQNLEFMNQEASAHFFKVNNQLRPPFSDINLISMAIYSYNKPKVSFPEICQWIEQTFPYYKTINQEWKVGIKNHLTLSKCFQKVPRKKDEVEKGGFWRFSNDFLNYLEKNQFMARNLNDIVINVQQENANHMQYKYRQCLSRKRPISSSPVENRNGSFKVPNKKANLGNNQIFFELTSSDQLTGRPVVRETADSMKLKSESTMNQFYNSNPINVTNDTVRSISLVSSANLLSSQMSRRFEQNKFDTIAFHSDVNEFHTIAAPCPEQLTEEEFLSGRVFNHYYTTNQSNIENTHALLDSQINFNSSDFNIHDLSITGIKIRPPEWWEQSLSASQISISRLGYSLRSLASLSNTERGSPFAEEDHHITWPNDQNLEELDMLFGLG